MTDKDIQTSAEAMEAAALPDAHVVHCDPCAPKTPEQLPLPQAVKDKPVAGKSEAEWAYERLILFLENFEQQLDAEHEVAMGFTGSEAGVMRIEGLGFFGPDILTFYGTDMTGANTQMIQHVSQLNVTLRALPKRPDQPAQRIGFRLAQDLAGDGSDGNS